ncbi:FG-GAP-like repeat-containing protein [Microbacterium sp. NPDC089695]|uniref:FG-GAP-like repeat-containing protein n=1 Tax=Microbacterium sp. NPDC089695 TaxID=3364198 RepID=UPI00380D11AC
MIPTPGRRLPQRRRIPATLVLLLALSLTVAAAVVPTTATAASGPAGDVFSLTNSQRTQAGLRPLVSDPALDAAAAEWARYLANSCTFEHSTASWRSARIASSGWSASGENIAAGQPDASAVVTAWMNSSGHRANILDSRYTGLGVGYATGTCYRTYWVQVFGIGSPVRQLPGGAGDLTGDRKGDVVALSTGGSLAIYPGTGTGTFRAAITVDPYWGDTPFTTLGDFTGDGNADLARVDDAGGLILHSGDSRGGLLPPVQIGSGWGGFAQLIGGLDFTGDRLPDVIARTTTGDLYVYAGNGRGGWLSGRGVKIGNGWSSLNSISHAGDFNGDSRGDLIARSSADGSLWLYPSTGSGGWGTPVRIGSGWGSLTSIHGAGDIDGDGAPDVIARSSTGDLLLYPGNGRGGFLSSRVIGSGWNVMSQIG